MRLLENMALAAIVSLFGLMAPITAMGEEPIEIGEVRISGEKLFAPTMQLDDTVYTGTEVTKEGIDSQGPSAKTSVYKAIDILPGISVESADPYGLSAEQSSSRIRGMRGSLGAMTVEGVPNYGGNPIGPRDYIYDMENLQSISVYKGAVPGDLGTGVGDRGGAIELKPRWPAKEFGAIINQGVGTDSYNRTFLRLDSGSLTDFDTRFSGSYSYTQADKWKGPGEIGPRNNANLALSQPLGQEVSIDVWFNYNDLKQDLYRALSYSQVQNLSDSYKFDYNPDLTGKKSQDIYYYKYNTGAYKNTDVLGLITINHFQNLIFTIKPYYSVEDSQIYQGVTSGGGRIQKRNRDIERPGAIAEAKWDADIFTATLGYHFEKNDMKIFSENYGITSSGLAWQGYGNFASPSASYINSPYFKIAGTYEDFDLQAGLKYFRYDEGASQGYVTDSKTYELVRAPDLDREERVYDILLPTLGVGYHFSEAFQVYASYGKSFIRPYSYMPLVNLYNTYRQRFIDAGITLNDLFSGYEMEETDTVDVGVRWNTSWFDITPTVFFNKSKNLFTNVYDPRVDLSYQQNSAEASGYGIDVGANFYLAKPLTFFINPSWTVLRYDEDIDSNGSIITIKDNQVVDTPEFLVKAGLLFKWENLEIIPMVRFMSSRYANAENSQKVDAYAIADLRLAYEWDKIPIAKSLKFSLDLNNLFDKEYISYISASDYTTGGSASYYPGGPFTAVFMASLTF